MWPVSELAYSTGLFLAFCTGRVTMKTRAGLLVGATMHRTAIDGDVHYVTHVRDYARRGLVLCAKGLKDALGRVLDLPEHIRLYLWNKPGRGRMSVCIQFKSEKWIRVSWSDYGYYNMGSISILWLRKESKRFAKVMDKAGDEQIPMWLSVSKVGDA
jgi:hypothetical protein